MWLELDLNGKLAIWPDGSARCAVMFGSRLRNVWGKLLKKLLRLGNNG